MEESKIQIKKRKEKERKKARKKERKKKLKENVRKKKDKEKRNKEITGKGKPAMVAEWIKLSTMFTQVGG